MPPIRKAFVRSLRHTWERLRALLELQLACILFWTKCLLADHGIARRIVPFCGVAAADVLNIGITRRDEFLEGIKVFDDNGDEIGQSRQAGARAVSACIAGRIFAAAPVLVVPPLVMHRLERTAFYSKHPALRIPTLMAMVAASIQISVPLSFGIFKQQASVSVDKIEDSFHNRVNRFGQPVTRVFYNKGV